MMKLACILGAAIAASVVTGAVHACAAECAPAQVVGDPTALPQAWRQALEALVAATGKEGQPWSCPDARVALIPPSDRGLAELEVEDASGRRRRPVASPEDVVPLGEAMLAHPVASHPADNPLPPPPAPSGAMPNPAIPNASMPGATMPGAAKPAAGQEPRSKAPPSAMASVVAGRSVLVDALVGAHYTGPTRAILLGPEVRATLDFERWSASLLGRYDASIATLQPVPEHFSLASATLGLGCGYRLVAAPVELVLALEPTLAVVFMGGQRPGTSEPDVDAHVDMRIGARLGAAIPLRGRVRAVGAVALEGAPAALFGDRHSRRHVLPELPGYLAGLSLGVEVTAIR
jgi:hypothetical protein